MTRTHLGGPQAFVSPSQIEVIEDVLVSPLAWAVLWPRWDGGNVFPNAVENPACASTVKSCSVRRGERRALRSLGSAALPRQLWTPAADRRSSRRTGGL